MLCDRVLPTCSACRKSRHPRHCEYAGSVLRVRPSVYTERVRGSTSSASTHSSSNETTDKIHSTEARLSQPLSVSTILINDINVSPTNNLSTSPGQKHDTVALVPHSSSSHAGHAHSHSSPELSGRSPPLYRWSPVPLPRTVVVNPGDAELFEFYIRETGVWLDVVSPTAYFSETVPRLALHDPVLFSACLSYAARIQALTGKIDKEQGELYGSRAIEALLDKLSSRSTAGASTKHDDVLSATVVILRMAEQFSEMQEDMRCHLMGASSLFARNPDHAFDGAVAFWVYKRQSIRMAVLNEEPCEIDMPDAVTDADMGCSPGGGMATTPISDEAWANRATYLFARACTVCWDTSLSETARDAMLTDLSRLLAQWHDSLPDTYQPWARYQLPNDPFPVVRYVSTWHVVGWQYYYAAKVLVGLYRKPEHMNVLAMSRYMESEVVAPTRVLCGITMASPAFGSTINGTALISWLGQVFSGKDDQNRLITFLQDFGHKTKWPNETCCDRLRRIWSGESQSWVQ
ncbi:hypothetical protein SEUCBS140593_009443 [Sporothrix eucalyptigena]|uniref:Uncharacterized protein n=1 Tax=Sporothrix eucalyptigena TaxID=1812306 RepID=A0ABP0CUU7_9PEZI